jgi:hypothetical protein
VASSTRDTTWNTWTPTPANAAEASGPAAGTVGAVRAFIRGSPYTSDSTGTSVPAFAPVTTGAITVPGVASIRAAAAAAGTAGGAVSGGTAATSVART